MPHRVTNFFRSSSSSLEDNITTPRNPVQTRSSRPRTRRPREKFYANRTLTYSSSLDDEQDEEPAKLPALKMHDSTDENHHHHARLSFSGLHFGTKTSTKDHVPPPNVTLDWKIESPPAIFFGEPETSSGALVSGQLLLYIKEDPVQVESLVADLAIRVTQKRPFTSHCHDCITQNTELQKWDLLRRPVALQKGQHQFPFSILLEGHLPASTNSAIVSISYEFKAEMTPKDGPVVKLAKTLDVKRSITPPELPHHSVRVFPPTNITASVHYPQVIHPTGKNTLSLRVDGVVKHNADAKTIEYWKLKRLNWRFEETIKAVAPACDKHTPREAQSSSSRKGLLRSETRVLGGSEMTKGWKSDHSGCDGNIEFEFDYGASAPSRPVTNVKSRDGTEVSHSLVVEMVVVQEFAPMKQPKNLTASGVARILRMHFSTIVTDRAGLGVSWDNEAPPIYQDVPPSPPGYPVLVCPADDAPDYDQVEALEASRNSIDSHP